MRFYVPLIAASLLAADAYAAKPRKKDPTVDDCKEAICAWTRYNPMPCEAVQTQRIHFFVPDNDDNRLYRITWYQEIGEEDMKRGRIGTNGSTVVNDPPRHKALELNNVNGNYPLSIWASLYREGEEPVHTAELFIEPGTCKKNSIK